MRPRWRLQPVRPPTRILRELKRRALPITQAFVLNISKEVPSSADRAVSAAPSMRRLNRSISATGNSAGSGMPPAKEMTSGWSRILSNSRISEAVMPFIRLANGGGPSQSSLSCIATSRGIANRITSLNNPRRRRALLLSQPRPADSSFDRSFIAILQSERIHAQASDHMARAMGIGRNPLRPDENVGMTDRKVIARLRRRMRRGYSRERAPRKVQRVMAVNRPDTSIGPPILMGKLPLSIRP